MYWRSIRIGIQNRLFFVIRSTHAAKSIVEQGVYTKQDGSLHLIGFIIDELRGLYDFFGWRATTGATGWAQVRQTATKPVWHTDEALVATLEAAELDFLAAGIFFCRNVIRKCWEGDIKSATTEEQQEIRMWRMTNDRNYKTPSLLNISVDTYVIVVIKHTETITTQAGECKKKKKKKK